MASEASRTFSSASVPPRWAASTTQWARCSSSSSSEKACSALVAAETWVQVVRGLRDFEGDLDGFRGWLFTIAHRRWVDHLRAESRRPPRQDEAAALDLPAPERVDEVAETVLSTERAVDLIGRLAPDQAEVVLLRVVADLDVAATAGVVGKSRGAVRVLTHRGLRRLATLLEREAVPDREPERRVIRGVSRGV